MALGYSERGIKLTSYIRLIPCLRMRGAVPTLVRASSQLGARTPLPSVLSQCVLSVALQIRRILFHVIGAG